MSFLTKRTKRVTLLSLALAFYATSAVKIRQWTGGRVVEGARLESV